MRGGSSLPRATPSNSPISSPAICFSSRISTVSPAAFPIRVARSANARGVSTFPGSFDSSRARFVHSPRTRPRSSARATPSACTGEPEFDAIEPRRRPLRRLVRHAFVVGEHHAFGQRLHHPRGGDRVNLAHGDRDARQPALPGDQPADDGDAAKALRRDILSAARADQQHAARLPGMGRDGWRSSCSNGLPGELAAGAGRLQVLLADSPVEARFVRKVVAFERRDDQKVGNDVSCRLRRHGHGGRRVHRMHRNGNSGSVLVGRGRPP